MAAARCASSAPSGETAPIPIAASAERPWLSGPRTRRASNVNAARRGRWVRRRRAAADRGRDRGHSRNSALPAMRRIAVQPLDDAAGKAWASASAAAVRRRTRRCRPLVEEDLPVLGRPAVTAGPKQRHDLGLVPGDRSRQLAAAQTPSDQVFAVDTSWMPAARAAFRASAALISGHSNA